MTLILFTVISVFSLLNASNLERETGDLKIEIPEIKNQKGLIYIVVYNSEEGFPNDAEKAVYKKRIEEYSNSIIHTFEDIPYGKYAIVIMQDKNGNGKMDRKKFPPRPKEPIGISNMNKLGKPNYSNALVDFNENGMVVSIKLMNQ
ncbi:MAG: DUF2141 domain-containing protein [Balneolaceae bacterium]